MINYKKEASLLLKNNRKQILPTVIFIGLLGMMYSLFEDFSILFIFLFLCIDYGYIQIARKVTQGKGEQINVANEGIYGILHYTKLFSTYILYSLFEFLIYLAEVIIFMIFTAIVYRDAIADVLNAFYYSADLNMEMIYELLFPLALPFLILIIVVVLTAVLYHLNFDMSKYLIKDGCKGLKAMGLSRKIMSSHKMELLKLYLSYALRYILVLGISVGLYVISEQLDLMVGLTVVLPVVISSLARSIVIDSNLVISKYLFYYDLNPEIANELKGTYKTVLPEIEENYPEGDHLSNFTTIEGELVEDEVQTERLEFEKITKYKLLLGCCLFLPFYLFIGQYVISIIFMLIPFFARMTDENVLNSWFNLFYDGVLLAIGMLCFYEFFRGYFRRFYEVIKDHPLLFTVVGIEVVYAVSIFGSNLVELITHSSEDSVNQETIEQIMLIEPVPMIISVVLIAPILEELVFRGLIFRTVNLYNRYLAHFVSAFLFGFVHVSTEIIYYHQYGEIVQIIPYFLMGLVFSIMYDKYKTLGVSVYFHMLNNLISVILIFLLYM